MREIKFRAWDGERLKPVTLWGFHEGFIMTSKGSADEKEFRVMQYTGLKDKNGEEIYEGDILECHHKTKGNVFFHDGSYGLSSDQCEFDLDDIQSYDSLNQYLIEDNNLIVIGNIHENPELLES